MSATIIRVFAASDPVTVARTMAEDHRLSFGARGLLLSIMACGDGASVGADGLATDRDGRFAVRRFLGELESAGYITRRRVRVERGRFQWELTASDVPSIAAPSTVQPSTVQPQAAGPLAVAPSTVNRPMATSVNVGVSAKPAAPVAVPPTRDVLSPPPLTQDQGTNGSGSNDPSPSRRQRAAGTRRAATPPDPRVKALTEALADWQGYTACNWAAEGAAAKRIIAAGYTVDDARTVWRRMKGEAFWADKHLPLASVFTQLGAKLGGPNGRKRDVIVLEPIRRGGVS